MFQILVAVVLAGVSLAQDRPDHDRRPRPAAAAEQLTFVNKQLAVNAAGVSLIPELGVAPGTRVVTLTVAVAPQVFLGRLVPLHFWIDGLRIERVVPSEHIEFIQIPVGDRVRENSSWILSSDAPVTLYGLGMTFEGAAVPPPAPVPVGPECTLLGHGVYGGQYWNYRIRLGNDMVDASDALATAIEKIERLERAGLCHKAVAPKYSLLGHGVYRGSYWNYRLADANGVFYATDSLGSVETDVRLLREHGLFRPEKLPVETCTLLGTGVYRGSYYRFRIQIGNEVVDAADSLETATSKVDKIRALGFCQ